MLENHKSILWSNLYKTEVPYEKQIIDVGFAPYRHCAIQSSPKTPKTSRIAAK